MARPALKPYAGLLVVSLEQAVAAPLASCHFAQGGARVIKVERPGTGDFARQYDAAVKGQASYFVWANHGKESLSADIKQRDDLALLLRILAKADIFIQNLAPGAAERGGLAPAMLRRRNPRLITCSISGYGATGSFSGMKAYDFLVQCESGLVAVNGAPGHPGRIGVSICDIGASMNAIIGIQKALYARSVTGEGSEVEVSLFDTAADWMTVPLMHHEYAGNAPAPAGLRHPSIAPYGGFTTGDDEILAISIQNEREWVAFCTQVLALPGLASDERFADAGLRVANRNVLDAIIAEFFSARTRGVLERLLADASIAFGAVNSVARFAHHPQLRRAQVTLQDGQSAELVAPAVKHSFDDPHPSFGKVPAIGEHDALIRREFAAQDTPSPSP